MNGTLSIEKIGSELNKVTEVFVQFCSSLTDEQFFFQPPGKWAPAQQVKHLVKSTDTSRLAFTLPKFIVRIVGGRPNRNSRSYEELVAKYQAKLEQGGKASGRYIPKPIPGSYGKEKLLKAGQPGMQKEYSILMYE